MRPVRTRRAGGRAGLRLLSCLALISSSATSMATGSKEVIHISSKALSAEALATPDTQIAATNGTTTRTRVLIESADKRFHAGLYSTGPTRVSIASYPVDEFLLIVDGNIRLTAADGKVLLAGPGDAVFVPSGWQGQWQSDGFKEVFAAYEVGADSRSKPPNTTAALAKMSSKEPQPMLAPDAKTYDVFKYRLLGKSQDGQFRAGMSEMRSERGMKTGSDVDEALITIDGSETFVSEGSAKIDSAPGDVVFMPKGWKGEYRTKGYLEFYAIYGAECMSTKSC
jgi:uncharacterized cupin superfamily protein